MAHFLTNKYGGDCQRNKICISMELVTAVLGDHGQRPKEDYGEVHCFCLIVE